MWKDIQEVNGWYISETFLIHGQTLSNPTWLSEKNLRAYWKHWYDLAQSGKPFTFKRVGAHDSDAHGDSDDPEEEGDEQVDNKSKEGDDGEVAKEENLEDEEKVDDQPGEDDNSGVDSQSGKKNAEDGESEDSVCQLWRIRRPENPQHCLDRSGQRLWVPFMFKRCSSPSENTVSANLWPHDVLSFWEQCSYRCFRSPLPNPYTRAINEQIITSYSLLISLINLLVSPSPHTVDNSIFKFYCT